MGASSSEDQLSFCVLINQQPIWLDMALPGSGVISDQLVWAGIRRKWFVTGKQLDKLLELLKIKIALLCSPVIPPERGGRYN